jgi:hypothetical protein
VERTHRVPHRERTRREDAPVGSSFYPFLLRARQRRANACPKTKNKRLTRAPVGKPVPESYQARQITITVRTIVSGLAYLATFVYAANGTGLVALAAQKWLDKLTGVDLIDEQAAKWEEEKKAQEREEQ